MNMSLSALYIACHSSFRYIEYSILSDFSETHRLMMKQQSLEAPLLATENRKRWTRALWFLVPFITLLSVRGCGMACIMVMMTYSMVRIELVYFIQNSGLHYCTSEKTLPYHLFSPLSLYQ
nr:uncharacterized protein LOC125419545 [Ziziphus jujuba var. spinosa]